MEYSDTVYLKAARKRERETKADDIIMRDEAILAPRVGGMMLRQRNAWLKKEVRGKMRIEMEMGMQIFGSGDWGSPEKVVYPRAHDTTSGKKEHHLSDAQTTRITVSGSGKGCRNKS